MRWFFINEIEVLETTYLDLCTIQRLDDVEDPETGLTIQAWVDFAIDVKCALSQNTVKDALPVVENTGMVNVTYDDQKLFISPGINILKGDRFNIIQSTGQSHVLYAKKPFYYPAHTEINVTGSDING